MSREVCGMCWCPYGDDGRCACPVEEVSSKPVAWLELYKGKPNNVGLTLDWFDTEFAVTEYKRVPLYTHTVKQLSDEEILDIKATLECMYGELPPLDFARAIIKEITE